MPLFGSCRMSRSARSRRRYEIQIESEAVRVFLENTRSLHKASDVAPALQKKACALSVKNDNRNHLTPGIRFFDAPFPPQCAPLGPLSFVVGAPAAMRSQTWRLRPPQICPRSAPSPVASRPAPRPPIIAASSTKSEPGRSAGVSCRAVVGSLRITAQESSCSHG